MSAKENQEILRRWLAAQPDVAAVRHILKASDPLAELARVVREAFGQILTRDCIIHSVDGDLGFEEYVQGNIMLFTGMPDLTFTTDDMFGEGDMLAWRYTCRGTHTGPLMGIPGTGKKIKSSGVYICRFNDGKIGEIWTYYDSLGIMKQLGVIPEQ